MLLYFHQSQNAFQSSLSAQWLQSSSIVRMHLLDLDASEGILHQTRV